MNQNTMIRFVAEKLLGTFVRHGVTVLGAWLISNHIGSLDAGTQTNLTDIILGAICVLIGLTWSYARSHISANEIGKLQDLLQRFGIRPVDVPKTLPPSIPPAALFLFTAFMASAFIGCAVVAPFDQNSYDAAQSLKSASLALLQKANEPASKHTDEIEALKVRLSSQLSYEQGKGKTNITSATQWEILISSDRDLLGKLIADWQAGKTFSDAYLTEKRQQIADAFDQIIRLEGAKNK